MFFNAFPRISSLLKYAFAVSIKLMPFSYADLTRLMASFSSILVIWIEPKASSETLRPVT